MQRLKMIVLIGVSLILLVSCGDPAEQFEIIKGYVPQAIEVFEQSKEQLDILRNGEFSENAATVRLGEEGLYIFFSGHSGTIEYEDWDTIEWLSEKEKNAILFLMCSEELQLNFTWIAISTDFVFAEFFTYRRARLAIHHGEGGLVAHQSYTVDLGDGYTLWAYIMAGG